MVYVPLFFFHKWKKEDGFHPPTGLFANLGQEPRQRRLHPPLVATEVAQETAEAVLGVELRYWGD